MFVSCPSVRPLPLTPCRPIWRDAISLQLLATNMRHVSEHCWQGFQAQKSKVKIIARRGRMDFFQQRDNHDRCQSVVYVRRSHIPTDDVASIDQLLLRLSIVEVRKECLIRWTWWGWIAYTPYYYCCCCYCCCCCWQNITHAMTSVSDVIICHMPVNHSHHNRFSTFTAFHDRIILIFFVSAKNE